MDSQIRKKHLLCFLLLSLSLNFSGFTQDIHFSQYNLAPLLINPAQAGAYKNLEAILSYRTQWTSITPNAYRTAMFTTDVRLMHKKWKEKKWFATGLNVFSDKAGDSEMGTTEILTSLGYHTLLSDKSTLGGALFGGYAQRSIDYTNLTWDEQYQNGSYNSANPTGENLTQVKDKFGYPDVGLGLLYQYNKGEMYATANDRRIVHAGLALFHMNRPPYSYLPGTGKLYMKITGHADALLGIKNTNFALLPALIYTQQGPSQEIYSGCYFSYVLREKSKFTGFVKGAAISAGTHFRVNNINKDAFIPALQLEIAEYTIGLSYDVNISDLGRATSGKGGFEIHLRYGDPNPFHTPSSPSFGNGIFY